MWKDRTKFVCVHSCMVMFDGVVPKHCKIFEVAVCQLQSLTIFFVATGF